MKSSPSIPRWRPMKTAPKDGTYIQIAYPSFNNDGTVYVGHGRWVDCPSEADIMYYLTDRFHNVHPGKGWPHWEIAYISTRYHSLYGGRGYEARSVTINNPLGWLPLPKPPKVRRKKSPS